MQQLNRYLAELVGTYCLVFAGCGAIVIDGMHDHCITHPGIALVFGMIVMAMIYSIGDLSGAHINPAVSIAFWLAGRFAGKHVAAYIGFQIVGAILASLSLLLLFPGQKDYGCTLPAAGWLQTFVMEVILSCVLMFVILRVSSGSKEAGIMAGAAIGITVALEAMFAGPVTGASMNPARSLGPAMVSMTFQHLWIYLVATVLGTCLAVPLNAAVSEADEG